MFGMPIDLIVIGACVILIIGLITFANRESNKEDEAYLKGLEEFKGQTFTLTFMSNDYYRTGGSVYKRIYQVETKGLKFVTTTPPDFGLDANGKPVKEITMTAEEFIEYARSTEGGILAHFRKTDYRI